MSTSPRVKITREIPGDEVTLAALGEAVEISIALEFNHGDHDRAALALDQVTTEILERLAALACPCRPGAPAHAHGRGGYAPEPPADTSRLSSVEERRA